jgi:hypothetical protein
MEGSPMNKQIFNEKVTDLIERTKAGDPELLDRQKRIKKIDELIENYVMVTDGKTPEPYELERLGSLILREELTDMSRNKMSANDNPIMSDDQYARRTEGRHQRKSNNAKEIGFNSTLTIAVDGKDYRLPIRNHND